VALDLPAFVKLAMAVKAASGLSLPRTQLAFIEARLQPAVRRLELGDAQRLIQRLCSEEDPVLMQAVFECLAPGETSFFRDKTPFDQLRRELLPALAQARGDRPVRVLCAGCSTGQEAYSTALLAELMRGEGGPVALEVVGTDLSERRLEKAASGLYTQFEVQRGLPIRLLLDWFEPAEDMWRVSPRLRQAVSWRRANLLDPPEPGEAFDVILCRNVLSSFEEDVRRGVLERLASTLASDGLLVLGLSETVHGVTDAFRPAPGRRGLYAKNPDASRRRVA
jgi:chemotaxis protein methyltransferase CheR